jgi:hypothetical protein
VFARGGQAWVHDWCWTPWMADLRDEARNALMSAGIQVGHPRASRRRRSR